MLSLKSMTSISVILVSLEAYCITFSQSDSILTSRSPSSRLETSMRMVLSQVFILTVTTDVTISPLAYALDGPTEIRYALLPHAGDWREAGVWEACCGWNEPLYVRAAERESVAGRPFVEIEGAGYELSSARRRGGEAGHGQA